MSSEVSLSALEAVWVCEAFGRGEGRRERGREEFELNNVFCLQEVPAPVGTCGHVAHADHAEWTSEQILSVGKQNLARREKKESSMKRERLRPTVSIFSPACPHDQSQSNEGTETSISTLLFVKQ